MHMILDGLQAVLNEHIIDYTTTTAKPWIIYVVLILLVYDWDFI